MTLGLDIMQSQVHRTFFGHYHILCSLHQLHYDDQEMEDCYFVLRIQVAGLRDMEPGQPSSTVLKTGNEAMFKVDGSIIMLILYIKI